MILAYAATEDVRRGVAGDELPDPTEGDMATTRSALEALGMEVASIGVSYDSLDVLAETSADLVMNLVDGNGLDGVPGVEVPLLLARQGIPFTGCGPTAYDRTVDKLLARERLRAARVPVPRGAALPHPFAPLRGAFHYPVIVKPRFGYASLGVDARSVVHDEAALRQAAERLASEWDTEPTIEEYVDGREISVAVLGLPGRELVLPPLEVVFGDAFDGQPRIRTMQSKLDPTSPHYWGFSTSCPARLSTRDEARVRMVALRAYRAMGGDGYARVDMRLGSDGVPWVIEVNANPSLEVGPEPSDCGLLPLIGRALGWTHPLLLGQIVAAGLERGGDVAGGPAATVRWTPGGHEVRATRRFRRHEAVLRLGAPAPGPEGRPGAWPLRPGHFVYPDPPARFLPHSDRPNLAAVIGPRSYLTLRALRDIEVGEPLDADRSVPLSRAVSAAVSVELTDVRRRQRSGRSRR